MGDPTSPRSSHGTTLQKKFELEKRRLSYADRHCEAVKNLPHMAASPSNHSQKQRFGSKAMEQEEIVRHMSNLPSYLERGKATQDRVLNFGVMDWGRLERWQYQHLKQAPVRNNKCSPTSSNSSSLFSTVGLSPQSSRAQSCSPALQKPQRVTLQSHFSISPEETFPPYVKSCLENTDKLQGFEDTSINRCPENITINRLETKPKDCKMYDSYPHKLTESGSSVDMKSCQTKSSFKGKMKVQDEAVNEPQNFQHPFYRRSDLGHLERHKTMVLLPRNRHRNSETKAKDSVGSDHMIASEKNHYLHNHPLQSEVVLQMEPDSARNASGISRSNALEEKRSTVHYKNSDLNMTPIATSKQRSMSPIRRFSFSVSSKSAASTHTPRRAESPVSQKSTRDNSRVSSRSHSSPLRRLLEPLFPSKATNAHQYAERSHEDSKTKAKAKLDLRNSLEVIPNDDPHRNQKAESTSTKQALFQTAFKNGRPLFTFAVENNKNILAATVRNLSSSGEDDSNSWIYTFFTVDEVKKKNGSWLSQSCKDKRYGYVPNIAAQMKVSNATISSSNTREFVLFSVDPSQRDSQISNVQVLDELAAIVVKFSRKMVEEEDNQESFSTTVILPGGNHGVSSKGKPSPLIERWLSGGVCDCGGWDVGCRLRTLTNQVQSSGKSSLLKAGMTTDRFELFFQGEVVNERCFFSLYPLNEGIFLVEYNSSLSILQAFSVCISVVECRTSSRHTESRTYVAEQVQDDPDPISFASFPPLSPVGRV